MAGDWPAQPFEGTRGHPRAVAFRMPGPAAEADDAVPEAWLGVRGAASDAWLA